MDKKQLKVEQGIRLSRVLKETHTHGKELGQTIGRKLSPQQVSAMRNGRASMTPKTAELINSTWPVYSISWLMGEGDREYRNEDERERAEKRKYVAEVGRAHEGVEAIALSCGFNIVPCGDGGYILGAYKHSTYIDGDDMLALVEEIRDFVDFKLTRLLKERG